MAISSITPTDERKKLVDFTQPYAFVPYAILQPASLPPVQRLEELAGKKVAVPKGPALTELKTPLSGATVVEAGSLSKALALLRKKKVDFVAGESLALTELIDDSKEKLSPVALGKTPLAIAVPKGSAAKWEAELKKIEPALKELEGVYRPGTEVSSAVIKLCSNDDAFASVNNGVVGPAQKPSVNDWFIVDWALSGTPDSQRHSPEGENHLCVSAPVRVGKTVPKEMAKVIKSATGQIRLEYGGRDEKPDRQTRVIHKGKSVAVDSAAPGVLKFANGVRVSALSWTLSQQCVETDLMETGSDSRDQFEEGRTWDCPAQGLLLVLSGPNGQSVASGAKVRVMKSPVKRRRAAKNTSARRSRRGTSPARRTDLVSSAAVGSGRTSARRGDLGHTVAT